MDLVQGSTNLIDILAKKQCGKYQQKSTQFEKQQKNIESKKLKNVAEI